MPRCVDYGCTDADGRFTVSYAPQDTASLVVRVHDQVLRRLTHDEVAHDADATVLTLPDPIVLRRADVEGLVVTGGILPDHGFTTGNDVK